MEGLLESGRKSLFGRKSAFTLSLLGKIHAPRAIPTRFVQERKAGRKMNRTRQFTVPVIGMTCLGCAGTVEASSKQAEAVVDAAVNFAVRD